MGSDLIAVTSMAVRCAGADNTEEFWRLLQAGRPQFRQVPENRWTIRPTERRPGIDNMSYSNVMAAMDDPFRLDIRRHKIPLARARRMDPQQRLAVSLAEELFERSGHDVRASTDSQIATIIGISSTDYRAIGASPVTAQMLFERSLGSAIDPAISELLSAATHAVAPMSGHSVPGILANMVPAAVQSVFDLHGPAFAIDAACASAMAALDTACLQLQHHRVNACVAGGIFTNLTPEAHIGFSAIGALSPSGKCNPFTTSADGFVIGEGGALFLLRRYEDALASNDPILGIIEAIGASNDGRAPGVMTPTVSGQIQAIEQALEDQDQKELEVDAIEGHGTGTTVGDQTELQAITTLLSTSQAKPVHLGSVKALVGHTMAASGALSLAKALLTIINKEWTPQPYFDDLEPNPLITDSPLSLTTSVDDNSGNIQRVAVNSFGFGGTNYHLVVADPEKAAANV